MPEHVPPRQTFRGTVPCGEPEARGGPGMRPGARLLAAPVRSIAARPPSCAAPGPGRREPGRSSVAASAGRLSGAGAGLGRQRGASPSDGARFPLSRSVREFPGGFLVGGCRCSSPWVWSWGLGHSRHGGGTCPASYKHTAGRGVSPGDTRGPG